MPLGTRCLLHPRCTIPKSLGETTVLGCSSLCLREAGFEVGDLVSCFQKLSPEITVFRLNACPYSESIF